MHPVALMADAVSSSTRMTEKRKNEREGACVYPPCGTWVPGF